MTSLQAIDPSAVGPGDQFRPNQDNEAVSAAVARDLHADALHLKRAELLFALPWLAVALVVGGFVVIFPRQLWIVAVPAFGIVVWFAQLSLEWWRLRRADPLEHYVRERREDLEHATALAEHEVRWAAAKPLMTQSLAVAIAVVTAVQFVAVGVERSVSVAALVKPAARAGEWWRLLTASYLHGSLAHLIGNVAALLVLGGLIEAYDKRMRVPFAYLAGVLGGSLASLALMPGSGLGASAGVLGLAGYLFALAYRQRDVIPKWLRQSLLRMLGATAISGLAGFFFIDNVAHAGGLVAGMLVGVLTIPAKSVRQPDEPTLLWDTIGWAASVALLAGAIFTVVRLLQVP